MENDTDPENNLLLNILNNCNYYTDDQFNTTTNTENTISIIDFNSKSLYVNFQSIKHYLSQLSQPFNIIATTETWGRGTDFEMDGYEMICKNRENKNGGGVALFVDKKFNYRVVEKNDHSGG